MATEATEATGGEPAEARPRSPAIECRGVTRRYAGVVANDQIDLQVAEGEIHALVGENGAGKSTLMKMLYGLEQPDEGEILVRGEPQVIDSPRKAIELRIGMVHQHFMLVEDFTVAENIVLGAEPSRGGGRLDRAGATQRVEELARGFGTPLDPNARVEDIGVGQQQRVEILKLLYRGADILILDEPTAVLVPQEVEELFAHMRDLKGDGKTIIFIAHSLDEVLEIADRITVLRDGKVIDTVQAADTDAHQVAEMMVGRPVLLRRVEGTATPGGPMLQVKDVRVTAGGKETLAGLDLDVRRSEIYGLAGVEGNGQAELVEALVGLATPDTGRIYLDDDELTRADVRTRRQAGLAYIPEDRHARGMVLQMLVTENSVLGVQERAPFSRRGLLDLGAIRRRAVELIRDFRVKTPSVSAPAYALSGGNQQKLVLGREFASKPKLLDRRPPDPRPGHRGHPVRLAGAGRGPRRGRGRAADLLQPGGDPGPGRPGRGHLRRPHRGPVRRVGGDHERARPLHDRRPRRRRRRGAGGVKVEEKPPPPPEPEVEEAALRVPWGQRLRGWAIQLLAPAVSLLLAAVIGALVILIVQRSWGDVADVASAMWSYGLFNRNSVAFILGRATPLIFAGLAVAIAFKAGLFNIGVEGQYAIGALAAGYVGYQLSAPTVIHLPLTILAGMAGGVLWAAIPALLRVYRGAHEVISTIMMNFVANAVLLYLLSDLMKDPDQQGGIAQQQTPPIEPTAQVGSMVPFFNSIGFDFRGSAPVTWFFILAIVAAVLYALTIRRTRFGFELRVLGTNPRAAEPSGIRSNAMIMKAMLLSGAIAGLVALQDVIGIDDRMKLDYIRGYGFTGIAIALLGRNSGGGIVAAALLISFLDRGSSGIGLNTDVPKEVTTIMQGVIILTIVIAYELVRRMNARRQLREQHDRA